MNSEDFQALLEVNRDQRKSCPICRGIIVGSKTYTSNKTCIVCYEQTNIILTTVARGIEVHCHPICLDCMLEIRTPSQLMRAQR